MAAAGSRQRDDIVIEYPNREKGSSKTVKLIVVLLMLITAVLMAVVTFGGWEKLQGLKVLSISIIVLYVLIAFFIARWRSGMLPVAAAMGMILLIFAAVAGPEWFARDKTGFDEPTIDSSMLGLITLSIVPVQVLLIAFAMSGFRQNWQVEVEKRRDEPGDRPGRSQSGGAVAAPA